MPKRGRNAQSGGKQRAGGRRATKLDLPAGRPQWLLRTGASDGGGGAAAVDS